MGVDLSHLCSLLDRLASDGEDWEARQKVISEASGNSIASFTEGLKKIEVELASCLEIHKKKQAKLDLHKDRNAALVTEVDTLLKQREAAWAEYNYLAQLHNEKSRARTNRHQPNFLLTLLLSPPKLQT